MIDGDSLKNNAVHEVRKRGRRPSPEGPMESLHVRIPTDVYDELCRQASELGKPLAEHVRESLSDLIPS